MALAIFTVLNLYVSAMDWWNGLDPYKRGYYQGYILFGVVATVVSGLITIPAGGAGAAVIQARHAPKSSKEIKCIGGHPFWDETERDWLPARDLRSGYSRARMFGGKSVALIICLQRCRKLGDFFGAVRGIGRSIFISPRPFGPGFKSVSKIS